MDGVINLFVKRILAMDMFEKYELLPIEVQAILDKYSEKENDRV